MREPQCGRQRDGLVERSQRFLVALLRLQRVATIEIGINVVGLESDGPVVGANGVCGPVGHQPFIATGVARRRIIGKGRLHSSTARNQARSVIDSEFETGLAGWYGARLEGLAEMGFLCVGQGASRYG